MMIGKVSMKSRIEMCALACMKQLGLGCLPHIYACVYMVFGLMTTPHPALRGHALPATRTLYIYVHPSVHLGQALAA